MQRPPLPTADTTPCRPTLVQPRGLLEQAEATIPFVMTVKMMAMLLGYWFRDGDAETTLALLDAASTLTHVGAAATTATTTTTTAAAALCIGHAVTERLPRQPFLHSE